MFDLTFNLLANRNLKFEKGKISVFKQQGSLIPVTLLVRMLKIFEKKHGKKIYEIGRKEGESWFRTMNQDYGKLNKTNVISWGCNLITFAGWGILKAASVDIANKIIIYKLEDSAIAEEWGRETHAIDHLLRGLASGGISYILEKEMDTIEITCRAKGEFSCQFLVKPKEEFDQTHKKVKQQLGEL
ncbi:MAG: V4R domain-containing protein [archaeon]